MLSLEGSARPVGTSRNHIHVWFYGGVRVSGDAPVPNLRKPVSISSKLRASQSEVIAVSPKGYTSKPQCERAIAVMKVVA